MKKFITFVKDSALLSYEFTIAAYNFVTSNQSIRSSSDNFISGVTDGISGAIISLPLIKKDPKSYNILKTSIKLNIFFLLPIFIYYKTSAIIYYLLSSENSDKNTNSNSITDFIFITYYINQYSEIAFNNFILMMTIAWLPNKKNNEFTKKITSECNSKLSNEPNNDALFLRPLALGIEQVLINFSEGHKLLKFSYYALFSLYNGRCLIKNQIGEALPSEKQQNEYLALPRIS